MGTLSGATQNQTALQGSQQQSASGLSALQSQIQNNQQMMNQQGATNALVASRVAQIASNIGGPTTATPYTPQPLATIATSQVGIPDPSVSRSSLLGN